MQRGPPVNTNNNIYVNCTPCFYCIVQLSGASLAYVGVSLIFADGRKNKGTKVQLYVYRCLTLSVMNLYTEEPNLSSKDFYYPEGQIQSDILTGSDHLFLFCLISTWVLNVRNNNFAIEFILNISSLVYSVNDEVGVFTKD